MLVKYFEQDKFKWKSMTAHFEGRTPTMLKNRYYAYIKKFNLYDELLNEIRHLENEKNILVDDMVEEEEPP